MAQTVLPMQGSIPGQGTRYHMQQPGVRVLQLRPGRAKKKKDTHSSCPAVSQEKVTVEEWRLKNACVTHTHHTFNTLPFLSFLSKGML